MKLQGDKERGEQTNKFSFRSRKVTACRFLDHNLTFDIHIQNLKIAGSRALGALINQFRHIATPWYKSYKHLFEAKIIPILTYSSGIWGYKSCPQLESVMNRCLRYFAGAPKKSPLVGLDGLFGWMRVQQHMALEMVRYYNRLVKMNENRLPKHCLLNGTAHYLNYLRRTLHKYLEGDSLLLIENCIKNKTPIDITFIKQQMMKYQETEWKLNLGKFAKLENVHALNTAGMACGKYGPQHFITSNLSVGRKALISQCYLGVLPIEVETGRWAKPPVKRELRICKMCQNGVEDVGHFLFHCKALGTKEQLPSNDVCRLDDLLSKPFSCSMYISDLWQKRTALRNNT